MSLAGLVGHVGLMGFLPSHSGIIYEEDKFYSSLMICDLIVFQLRLSFMTFHDLMV